MAKELLLTLTVISMRESSKMDSVMEMLVPTLITNMELKKSKTPIKDNGLII